MLRQVIPVRGVILGHNYYDGSDRDIGYGALGLDEGERRSDILPYSRIHCAIPGFGDYVIQYNFHNHNHSSREFYIRIARPHYARLVEVYLDLYCTFSGANGIKTVFTDCGSNLSPQLLSRSDIDTLWRKATGKTNSITGGNQIIINQSLKNIIPQSNSEAFALCLAFDSAPQNFYIERLNLLLGTEILV